MKITDMSLINDSASETKKLGKMEQAIKDYKDEYLTGLTDEEREKIKEEIQKALEEAKRKSGKEDARLTVQQLSNLITSLLKKYGYKGDIEAYAKQLLSEMTGEENNLTQQNESTLPSAEIAYSKSNHSCLYQKELILSPHFES